MNSLAVPIRRVFRIVNGGTPSASPENWGGDIAWATPADLAMCDGAQILSTQRSLTPVGLKSGSNLVPGGGLIISSRAPIGYVVETVHSTAINQGCKGLIPKQDIDIRFFRYQLSAMTTHLQSLGQGSTFLEISSDALASCPISVPSLLRQRETADSLDVATARIDALLTKVTLLNDLLDERLRSTALSLFHGGDIGDYGDVSSPGVSQEIETWIPHKIAWHKQTASGATPKSGNHDYYVDGDGVPWVTTSELRERTIDDTAKHLSSAAFRDYPALKVFPVGTVLIAMYGATIGRVGALGIPAATNQACCAIYGGEELHQRYVYWWLWANTDYLLSMAKGSGQPNISQEVIRSVRIPAPSVEKQEQIVSRIEGAASEVASLRSKATQLRELLSERRMAIVTSAIAGDVEVT